MGLIDRYFKAEVIDQEPLKLNKEMSTLAELYGGIAMDKQWDLYSVIGSKSGRINAAKGTIKFGFWTSFPVQILGTYHISSQSFSWAWSPTHPLFSSDLIQQASALKSYGVKNGIRMLTSDLVPAEKHHLDLIGSIASSMFNASGYYLVEKRNHIIVVSLNGEKINNKAPVGHERVGAVIPQWFSWFEMIDERNALNTYLLAKGYHITWEGEEMTARFGEDWFKMKFDAEGRLAGFEAT